MLSNSPSGSDQSEQSLLTLEIPPYMYHLMTGNAGEESKLLEIAYEGDIPPDSNEIREYFYHCTKGYILSRWFERILYTYGVPGFITPQHDDDWSGDLTLQARGGECPIVFIEDSETYKALIQNTQKDIIIVYVGDINIDRKFFPYIDHVIEMMRNETKDAYTSSEIKKGITIEKMLRDTPMTYVRHPGGIEGVSINGSNQKGTISHKIMSTMDDTKRLKNKGGVPKSTKKVNQTKNVVSKKVQVTLRL